MSWSWVGIVMGRRRSVNGQVRAISNVHLIAPLNSLTRHRPTALLKSKVLLLPQGRGQLKRVRGADRALLPWSAETLGIQPGDRLQTAVNFQLDLIAETRAVAPVADDALARTMHKFSTAAAKSSVLPALRDPLARVPPASSTYPTVRLRGPPSRVAQRTQAGAFTPPLRDENLCIIRARL